MFLFEFRYFFCKKLNFKNLSGPTLNESASHRKLFKMRDQDLAKSNFKGCGGELIRE